jgi:hypothetical protein
MICVRRGRSIRARDRLIRLIPGCKGCPLTRTHTLACDALVLSVPRSVLIGERPKTFLQFLAFSIWYDTVFVRSGLSSLDKEGLAEPPRVMMINKIL